LLSGKVCKDRVKRVETLDNIGIVAMLMAVVILFSYNGFTLKDNSYLTQISSVTNNNIITMGLTDKFMINIIRPYQDSIDELNSKLKNSITLDDRLHLFTLIHKTNEEKVKKIREISRLKELFDNSKSQIVKDANVILEKNGIGKTIVHLEDQENNNIEKLHRVKMRDNAERNRLKAQLFIIEDRYNEAKESYQKALKYERTHITLFDYALFLQKHNYFDESIAIYEQLLIEQRALAKSKPLVYNSRVATTLNNLATIYKARNEIKRVEKTYLEALMLYHASDKTDLLLYYSKIAVTLNNLSAHYYSNNEIEKAEDTYLEALTLKQMLANSDS
jgi:tetratricopeptide (TPR) repeat protein